VADEHVWHPYRPPFPTPAFLGGIACLHSNTIPATRKKEGPLPTVEDIGIHDVPIVETNSDEDLDQGVIHLPETPMPWEEREQKNVYLAGHRVGNLDTTGRMVFFNLDKLKSGDEITLEDSSGETYEYKVSEIFVVKPSADWVIDPVRDRDMVTLQTCTYNTFFSNRIVVRADRV
jgi:sortase A